MPKWTSGNCDVDKIIQMTQSDENANEWEIWRWIDYSKLKNIEYLAEGGFGSIWKAEWIDMPEEVFEFYKSNKVALKKLKNSQEISSEFLKEVNIKYINIHIMIFFM
jgi:serine/threonine protein kinase